MRNKKKPIDNTGEFLDKQRAVWNMGKRWIRPDLLQMINWEINYPLMCVCVCVFRVYSLFNVSPAGHGVSIARAREDVYVVDDDKRFLLQGDDGEVVLICILVPVGVVPRPYWEHQRQSSILPASHLGARQHTGKGSI